MDGLNCCVDNIDKCSSVCVFHQWRNLEHIVELKKITYANLLGGNIEMIEQFDFPIKINQGINDCGFFELQKSYLDPIVERINTRPAVIEEAKGMINCFVRYGTGGDFSFDKFIDQVRSYSGNESILVRGTQGTGKSTFLSILWYVLIKEYQSEKDIFPCYIDLHYYDNLDISEAQAKFRDDLQIINKALSVLSASRVFFILDGIDTYQRDVPSLPKMLHNQISEYRFRVICLGGAEDIPSIVDQSDDSIWLSLDYCSILEVTAISRTNRDVLREVAKHVTSIYASTQTVSIDNIINTAIRYSVEKVDFRTILLITKIADMGIPVSSKNFGVALYEHYCKIYGEQELQNEAQYAVEYQLGIKPDLEQRSPRVLRHKNRMIRDFLSAFDFFNAVYLYSTSTRIKVYSEKLRRIFSVSVNRFLKDLFVRLSTSQQTKFTDNLLALLDSDTTCEMKTQVAYMLGRTNNSQKARKKLIEHFDRLRKQHFTGDFILKQSAISKTADLVLFRTIAVSLLCLEYRDYIKTYLKCLLYNPRMMEINRAFHWEYYNDIGNKSETSYYEDDISSDFSITKQNLSHNISNAIASGKFSYSVYLDIVTLVSFATSRVHTISNSIKNELIALANKILDARNTRKADVYFFKLDSVRSYVSLSRDILTEGDFFALKLITELYSLKHRKRAGWIKRNVENSESISDHMYFSVLMAMLFLPETIELSDWEDNKNELREYSKRKILSMLLVHELGEAYLGNKVSNEKTEKDVENEVARVRYYGLLSVLPIFFGLTSYSDFYDRYEKQSDINARIAKEMDVLEAYIQACLYSIDNENIDLEEWGVFVDGKIHTTIGKNVRKAIEQNIISKIFKGVPSMSTRENVTSLNCSRNFPNESVVWLQLSDLHFDPNNQNTNTQDMLKSLKEQISTLVTQAFGEEAIPSIVICNGDYRFAKVQGEKTAKDDAKAAADYLHELSLIFKIDKAQIIIVPGNHDVNRKHKHIRNAIIKELYKDYIDQKTSGKLAYPEQLKELMEGFSYFRYLLGYIYGDIQGEQKWQQWCKQGCVLEQVCGLQFLLINTALFSSDYKPEEGMLYGWGYPYNILERLDHSAPLIVVGHHGREYLEPNEQKELLQFITKKAPCSSKIYLCGHAHAIGVTDLGSGITQFTAGTLRQDDQISQAGIYLGKYIPSEGEIIVKSAYWDMGGKAWQINKNFNSGEGEIRIEC